MGMMIDDETYAPKPMSKEEIVDTLKTMVFGVQAFERFNAKERETLDKAWNIIDQYENRLKADLEAILVELQLEIEEKRREEEFMNDWNNGYNSCLVDDYNLIQQKIDKLKGKTDGR